VKPLLAIALFSAAVAAAPTVALAQDGGADPRAPDAYAGVSKAGFYAVQQQLDAAAQAARGNARAMAEIRSLRAFAAQQFARHGEIRDWDREAINTRLSRVMPQEFLTTAPAQAR
jgi:hypothetical protein